MPKLRAVCAPASSTACNSVRGTAAGASGPAAVRNLQTFPRERRDGETHIFFGSQCTFGFSLTRDRANARPEMFRIGDGWFTYNVVANS